MAKKTKKNYYVYVIELDKSVWEKSKKFRLANPDYNHKFECLYVGMTSNTPLERFQKHKAGYRTKKGIKISSSFVEKYGLFLRPSLYDKLNPLTKPEAVDMEKALAESLRKRGYAVWWN